MNLRASWTPLAFVAVIACAAASPACEADVDGGCTTGPCGGATVAAAATVTVAGSGGGGGGEPTCLFPDTGELPCDVFTVLADRCHKCHQDPPINSAPFSLLTWQSFQEIYGNKPIWERADAAIEPGNVPQMPFLEDPLPVEQRDVLNAWFATCAAGECAKAPAPSGASSGGTGGGDGGSGAGGNGDGGTGGD
jgi:hypothetical protein